MLRVFSEQEHYISGQDLMIVPGRNEVTIDIERRTLKFLRVLPGVMVLGDDEPWPDNGLDHSSPAPAQSETSSVRRRRRRR